MASGDAMNEFLMGDENTMAASLPPGFKTWRIPISACTRSGIDIRPRRQMAAFERLRFKVEAASVHHPRLDVRQTRLPRAFSRDLQHAGGDVSGQDGAGWADPSGGQERLLTGAGGHVEHAAPRAHTGQVEHHLRKRPQGLSSGGRATLPGLGCRLGPVRPAVLALARGVCGHEDLPVPTG